MGEEGGSERRDADASPRPRLLPPTGPRLARTPPRPLRPGPRAGAVQVPETRRGRTGTGRRTGSASPLGTSEGGGPNESRPPAGFDPFPVPTSRRRTGIPAFQARFPSTGAEALPQEPCLLTPRQADRGERTRRARQGGEDWGSLTGLFRSFRGLWEPCSVTWTSRTPLDCERTVETLLTLGRVQGPLAQAQKKPA